VTFFDDALFWLLRDEKILRIPHGRSQLFIAFPHKELWMIQHSNYMTPISVFYNIDGTQNSDVTTKAYSSLLSLIVACPAIAEIKLFCRLPCILPRNVQRILKLLEIDNKAYSILGEDACTRYYFPTPSIL